MPSSVKPELQRPLVSIAATTSVTLPCRSHAALYLAFLCATRFSDTTPSLSAADRCAAALTSATVVSMMTEEPSTRRTRVS